MMQLAGRLSQEPEEAMRAAEAAALLAPLRSLAQVAAAEARANAQLWSGRRPLSGPEACLLFGLGSIGGTAPSLRDARVLAGLGRASGDDCLHAAFALAGAKAGDLVAAVAERFVAPPFTDAEYFAAIARWLGCPFDDGIALALRWRLAALPIL